ncbi:hypothetical protein PR048_016434, partial [Dryococelus australis]
MKLKTFWLFCTHTKFDRAKFLENNKIRTVVSHFTRSTVSNERLLVPHNAGKEPKKLLPDMPTRWNSTFLTLHRSTAKMLKEVLLFQHIELILDRRFKTNAFTSDVATENVKKVFINIVSQMINDSSTTVSTPVVSSSELLTYVSTSQSSVWSSFDRQVASAKNTGTSKSRGITEECLLDRNDDPLQWWNTNKYNYSHLAKLIKENFCCVATSASC